ncbi:MAG: hypothetical protein BA862_06280 [Desulfobulbaceae bacterium S3730MH12]|nr:MAG: hypothetical protein BA862_06280 [Desulfobulbaceae bacterium S3730MH12]OEU81889.1 MAG: hypothetical protein BA873_02250 [Desulfobulbaceae bacterium C00003063]
MNKNRYLAKQTSDGGNAFLAHLKSDDLEEAIRIMDETRIFLKKDEFDPIARILEKEADDRQAKGDIRWAVRLRRRAKALKVSQAHGQNPEKRIRRVVLPEGYNGKVLLVSVSVRQVWEMTCLRSGDDWHHKILQATEEEICDYGFPQANVCPVGGAWIRFMTDGAIVIYGTSDDFGECDKELASRLIKRTFPEWKIFKQR